MLSVAPQLARAQEVRAGGLVGAHYYLWFPAQFDGGHYLRAKLRPPQSPQLGEYLSSSSRVVEQHIDWAASAGIDFFTLDWWPLEPQRRARIESFLAAANVSRMRFCVFYELAALGYEVETGHTRFDDAAADRFVDNMEEIAVLCFDHPQQLRVAGRPVVILYATRTATGQFESAMSRMRTRLRRRGFEPFVIADEIFWNVAKQTGSGTTEEPQIGRIQLFDALTAYNLFDSTRPTQIGYGATSTLVRDARELYARYAVAARDTPLVPLAFPGYNDRATRLDKDHPVIPREWSQGAGEGTFFAEWLRGFTLPQVDPRLPMLLVTSWNEWNEDTAIEPTLPAPPTIADVSPSGDVFTRGFSYSGYGGLYLDVLRSSLGR